ncbi:slc38a2 [Symbiodinium sp. CCMP2592]|nr:slc38a2 [Symbiodinium sp. CCMP2592]
MSPGLEELFFEPVGEEKRSKWNQVGPNRGSYIQIETFQNVGPGAGNFDKGPGGDFHSVPEGLGAFRQIQTYQHVGPGLGDFDKENVTSYSEWKLRTRCLLVMLLLLLVLVAVVSYLLLRKNGADISGGPHAQDFHGHDIHSLETVYNCDAGYAEWQTSWSESKKAFCCRSIGVACDQAAYDCDAAYSQWESMWSSDKKEYCCDQTGRGCSPVSKEPYDCQVGLAHWQSDWTKGKQLWCCSTHALGCPDYGYSLSFNCDVGFARWETDWSWTKKHWCCAHEQKGCQVPFNCQAGLASWRSGWSYSKQKWCCSHEHVGCLSSEPFDCQASADQHGWSEPKKHYCCASHSLGCETTTSPATSLPFDCSAGFSNWQHGWSYAKRLWCCHHDHRGCAEPTTESSTTTTPATTSPVPTLPFNCHAGTANLDEGWSPKKKSWCCAHQHLGCPVSFDCDAALANFYSAWSDRKKTWCCHQEGKGCMGQHQPHLQPREGYRWKHDEARHRYVFGFTCDMDTLDNEVLSVHLMKMPNRDPEDMADGKDQVHGYWTWVQAPMHVHQEHLHKEHLHQDHVHEQQHPVHYNCHAGFHNFVGAWKADKQRWCCDHQGIACTGPNPPAVHLQSGNTWVHVKVEGVWTWRQVPRSEGVPFVVDCSTGLDRSASWVPKRKAYCCTHEGKACN